MRAGSAVVAALGLYACGKPSSSARAGSDVAPSLPASVRPHAVDLANGELHFALCRSCHTIIAGGANMTGPNLHGVFGRRAAANPDFGYSSALRATGWVWDAPHLDRWLTDPRAALPGTKMGFHGLHDADDRRDLIAWLAVESRR